MPGKELFEALFMEAGTGLLVSDQKGMIRAVNPFCCQLFGHKENELLGHSVDLLVPREMSTAHQHLRDSFFENPQRIEAGTGPFLQARKKDGSSIPVEISLNPFKHGIETLVVATIRDCSVTQKSIRRLRELTHKMIRIRTEALEQTVEDLARQIKETAAKDLALQNLNHYLQGVLKHSGAMIFATDPDGTITLFNAAAEKQLGYSAEEIIGKATPELFHCADEIRDKAEKLSQRLQERQLSGFEVLVTHARNGSSLEQEWTYIRKDKKRFPVSLTTTALRNNKDEIIGYIGVAIDISERKNTQQQLLAAFEKERELNELKSRFVSIASHEFRTPLSTILSSVYLLQKYTLTEEQGRREKHISRIITAVNLLNSILNEFLSEGKLDEGKVDIQPRRFRLPEWVQETGRELEPLLKEGQEFSYRHEGGEMVDLDPVLLKHILVNLLTNAIKFSGAGKAIEIETRMGDGKLELSVKDRGIGISKKDQLHLFERFFRGANASSIQGTGLGLHIVARYTELMNGTIRCQSELDSGTQFTLSFSTQKNEP